MNTIKAVVLHSKAIQVTNTSTGEMIKTYLHTTKCGKKFSHLEGLPSATIIELVEKKAGTPLKNGGTVKQDGWLLEGVIGNRLQYQEIDAADKAIQP